MTSCRDNIDRFVFASSSACYGNVETLPTVEGSGDNPTSPYGLQKLVIEQFGKLYSDLYGLEFAALRFFNAYGPGQDGTSPYSTAISAWCTRLHKGEALRSDGDGLQTRDYTYVKDVVEANMLAMNSNNKEIFAEIFNVGTGTNHSVLDLVNIIEGDHVHLPPRLGEARDTLANNKKLVYTLGWQPKETIDSWISKYKMENNI